MIDRYDEPTAHQADYDRDHPGHRPVAAHGPRHRAITGAPTILRTAALPWRTRAWLFLLASLWHARKAGVYAVVSTPAVVSEWRRAHRWTSWREDLLVTGVAVLVTAIVVPLAVIALDAWSR